MDPPVFEIRVVNCFHLRTKPIRTCPCTYIHTYMYQKKKKYTLCLLMHIPTTICLLLFALSFSCILLLLLDCFFGLFNNQNSTNLSICNGWHGKKCTRCNAQWKSTPNNLLVCICLKVGCKFFKYFFLLYLVWCCCRQ